ncbi:AMIN domain-containing protein [Helicobacter mustelae]|uniref:Putative periplasmic protein n=1 Tax=Helicobacter mustelae (strain ATCC 43772 / CCUG 25715 / CIP 103759 / LMG 18044 / NCTC 12198 / R85-136P) TaxID=679897 RepID=D3UG25_HELM1|nr:AMIN domain-containing protein [Helicobacter mustelae]CBG39446.1 Putative periplasmic protein [Helicobacter mustelae 12198]SQH70957.1 periplasmic protein [Helicobacter mustelae]
MKRIFTTLFALFFLAVARDNPFESAVDPNMDSQTSEDNIKKNFESFDFKLPSTARILKSITITYQNIDGSIEQKILPIEKSVDWHYPIALTQRDAIIDKEENTQYFSTKKMIFFAKDSKLYITTKRKMLRNFILPEPFRIIIDLSKDPSDGDEVLDLKQKYFSSVTMSTHKNFFRISITLDGHYRYEITPSDDGYILSVQ